MLFVTLGPVLVAALWPGLTSSQEVPPRPILRGTELAQALRAGGYVIYFRHSTSDRE